MKRILITISNSILTLILLFGSFAFFTNATYKIENGNVIEGRINSIRSNRSLEIHVIGQSGVLDVYRPSHKYTDILSKIDSGDLIKVYTPSIGQDKSEVIQIEKDGILIFNLNEFHRKYFFASLLCFAGAIFIIFQIIRSWKTT